MKLLLALVLSCYCPLPHRGPACDCDQHKMCSECDPIQGERISANTHESDREIQEAFEEIAEFSNMREIEWDVQGHWTVILRYNRSVEGVDHWIVWTVTNAKLGDAVDQAEKDVYSFPDGHERK